MCLPRLPATFTTHSIIDTMIMTPSMHTVEETLTDQTAALHIMREKEGIMTTATSMVCFRRLVR